MDGGGSGATKKEEMSPLKNEGGDKGEGGKKLDTNESDSDGIPRKIPMRRQLSSASQTALEKNLGATRPYSAQGAGYIFTCMFTAVCITLDPDELNIA